MAILVPSIEMFEKLSEPNLLEKGLYTAMSAIAATVANAQARMALRRNRTRAERRRALAKARSRLDGGEKTARRCSARAGAAGRAALSTLAAIVLPGSPICPRSTTTARRGRRIAWQS